MKPNDGEFINLTYQQFVKHEATEASSHSTTPDQYSSMNYNFYNAIYNQSKVLKVNIITHQTIVPVQHILH